MDLTIALIGSVFTIIGVIVGAYITYKATNKLEKRKMLVNFYADFFSQLMFCVPFNKNEQKLAFLASAERLKLVCSSESKEKIHELVTSILDNPKDFDHHADIKNEIFKLAQKEINN